MAGRKKTDSQNDAQQAAAAAQESGRFAYDGLERVIRSFKVVEYSLPDGCCGAYYPEANSLVPLYAFDPQSRTPSYKSVPVTISRAAAVGADSSHHAAVLDTARVHHASE